MGHILRYFRIALLNFLVFSSTAFAEVDIEQGRALYEKTCTACHGADGNASAPAFPKLAGQNAHYFAKQLKDYQQGNRLDPTMQPIAQALSEEDIQNLLAFTASFTPTNGSVDPNLRAQGEKLFRRGDLTRNIPACAACHGPAGLGNAEAAYPLLAGQNPPYILQQLQNFQNQKRTNDPNQMMQMIASRLTPEDMQAVASFMSGLRST